MEELESSDNEPPEEFETKGSIRDVIKSEIKSIANRKKEQQSIIKKKRRARHEKYKLQKKVEIKFSKPVDQDPELEQKSEDHSSNTPVESQPKKVKKYPSLNIVVQPLRTMPSSRAQKAENFRLSRMKSISRVGTTTSVKSYAEKQHAKLSSIN